MDCRGREGGREAMSSRRWLIVAGVADYRQGLE